MTPAEMTPAEVCSAQRLIQEAFLEDLQASYDLTTNALVPEEATGTIRVVSRGTGVLAGNTIAQMTFQAFDQSVEYEPVLLDGQPLGPGSVIAEISGAMRSLLTVERTALNFLTMLSGTATLTRQFVTAIAPFKTQILDTRKTFPGLRELQKYAVRAGGGRNHRMGLFDAVLIKDNHLAWWNMQPTQTMADAVRHVRETVDPATVIEIEVDTLSQFDEVLPARPDIILLDNMPPSTLRRAVEKRNKHAPELLLEASGGVNLDSVVEIAATGVDRISVGALTHSAVALDIGFDWGASSPAS